MQFAFSSKIWTQRNEAAHSLMLSWSQCSLDNILIWQQTLSHIYIYIFFFFSFSTLVLDTQLDTRTNFVIYKYLLLFFVIFFLLLSLHFFNKYLLYEVSNEIKRKESKQKVQYINFFFGGLSMMRSTFTIFILLLGFAANFVNGSLFKCLDCVILIQF